MILLVIAAMSLAHGQELAAEIYRGIVPYSTLGDVRDKFPRAKFEKLSPGWLTEDDALISITGEGMAGSLVLKFYDPRPMQRRLLEMAQAKSDQKMIDRLTRDLETPENGCLIVVWVRYVPEFAIPLKRLISQWGPPDKKGFQEEDFMPYREWTKRSIQAVLDDGETMALRIDFNFTKKENDRQWALTHKSPSNPTQKSVTPLPPPPPGFELPK